MEITIPTEKYIEYKKRLHGPGIYPALVTPDEEVIQQIASRIRAKAGGDLALTAELLLSFVQDKGEETPCIRATRDRYSYAKYPIETLVEGCGDCEDHAVLYASLLEAAGINAVLVVFENHVMTGVHVGPPYYWLLGAEWYVEHEGRQYYLAETTGQGWRVGMLPERYQGQQVRIVEVGPLP